MREFTVVDLTGQGELKLQARYEYGLLEKIEGAVELLGLFAAHIWKSPQEFETTLRPAGEYAKMMFSQTAAAFVRASCRNAAASEAHFSGGRIACSRVLTVPTTGTFAIMMIARFII